ncbi:MAG: hypothetical protein MUF45_18800 [Spirosomaceae bacterium]|jgi:hypothetical protein|nr:hypothetical protein [Spirosomataceae bacterium]
MRKLFSIFKNGFKTYQYLPLIVVLVPLAVYYIFNNHIQLSQKTTFWDKVIDPALSVSGFVLPAFIWLYYIFNKDWKDGLSKRVNVHFVLNKNYVLTCFESNLSSEGDMRNWGQQIGLQMVGGNLSFLPYINSKSAVEEFDDERKEYYLLYEITFYLRFDDNGDYIPTNPKANIDKDVYRIWIDNNYDTPGNNEIIIKPKSQPITLQEARAELASQQNNQIIQ